MGNVPHCTLRRATYQLAGPRRRPTGLTFDPSVVDDLHAWLEERLGELAGPPVVGPVLPPPEVRIGVGETALPGESAQPRSASVPPAVPEPFVGPPPAPSGFFAAGPQSPPVVPAPAPQGPPCDA